MTTTNTNGLRGLLRDLYPPPEWAMAFEVQADRAAGGLRFADAVAVNTRKSSSMPVVGFELKVSRADLRHELNDPTKAQAAASLCDYWWLVVGHPKIVKDVELPPRWGVLVASDEKLHIKRPASRNEERTGVGMDRGLMAAIMRRLLNEEATPKAYWEGKIRSARQAGFSEGKNYGARTASKRLRTRPSLREIDEPLILP